MKNWGYWSISRTSTVLLSTENSYYYPGFLHVCSRSWISPSRSSFPHPIVPASHLIPLIDFGGVALGYETSGSHQITEILFLTLVKYVSQRFSKRERRNISYDSNFLWVEPAGCFGSGLFSSQHSRKTPCRRWTYNDGYFIVMQCLEELSTGNITWEITLLS